MKYRFTRKSGNVKTGPIPVTTTERKSCPSICPLRDAGCYGDGGPIRNVWNQTATTHGISLTELCKEIAALQDGQLWRHNQVGDLPHNKQVIDAKAVAAIIRANHGKRGFTYTHHDMSKRLNRIVIGGCNVNGFTVNLSANNLTHADSLMGLGIGPVVTILPIEPKPEDLITPNGHRVIICPAVTGATDNCASCKLCAEPGRKTIIGFPAHGMRKRKASELAGA